MKLSHTTTIAAPVEKVWAVVMDVPLAARCLPGVAAVTPTSAGAFKGSLLVQVGPMRLVLDGVIAVTSRDDAARRASLRAEGKDNRLGGTVRATVDIALSPVGAGCQLRLDSDVEIGGRIGELGQPVIQRRSDQLLAQFAQCLGRSAAG